MKQRFYHAICLFLIFNGLSMTSCAKESGRIVALSKNEYQVVPKSQKMTVKSGFDFMKFDGDYGFEQFLQSGGAKNDGEVVNFLVNHVVHNINLKFLGSFFGCSTVLCQKNEGGFYFGRNFDWARCNCLVLVSECEGFYKSVSTVNTDFIKMGMGKLSGVLLKSDELLAKAALFCPLDGMNEKGFSVCVNMISDGSKIEQNSFRPDITTTTAIRLLLNYASSVDEAVKILSDYDMHSSMGMMVHFAMADKTGKSVVVEYVNNQMKVIETPVVTNFYLDKGSKYGIGSSQSHERYKILLKFLENNKTVSKVQVRDALDSVSKDNFEEFSSTEWSVVFDLEKLIATYFHREDYTKSYEVRLNE